MSTLPTGSLAKNPTFGARPDYALMNALTKVSPQAQAKAKANAQDFEAVFLNSMFQQMFSGIKGDGPMGSSTGTSAWRSMLIDEHAKSFAKAGGVGVSDAVYRTLIMQQAAKAG